jgi:hypothetical protein
LGRVSVEDGIRDIRASNARCPPMVSARAARSVCGKKLSGLCIVIVERSQDCGKRGEPPGSPGGLRPAASIPQLSASWPQLSSPDLNVVSEIFFCLTVRSVSATMKFRVAVFS